MELSTPVGKLVMVGPVFRRRLEKLEIHTVLDLLSHFPFRYDDFSLISKIANLQVGELVTVQGKITKIKNEFTRNRRFIQRANIEDTTGNIDIVWFNQTYLTRVLVPGTAISISGKVEKFRQELAFVSPQFEIMNRNQTIHTGRLVPIYPETYGISSKWLRSKVHTLLSLCQKELVDYLPQTLLAKEKLMPFAKAIQQIHFPDSQDLATLARERLSFDEFLLMQLVGAQQKKEWERKRTAIPLSIAKFKNEITAFWKKLPFELTDAQKKAVKEIFADLAKTKTMNRLLEGDVGSGKTVVATIGMYLAFLNNFQSMLMAPTQILAQQHYGTVSKLLTPLGVKVGLITGSKKTKVMNQESRIRNQGKKNHHSSFIIHHSQFDILVGTHALISESVKADNLNFVVIDEQHRFGVEQRALLLRKGNSNITPHILTMTATPIPRTVVLTMYGNLDLSYLDQMPKGRIPIKTWVVSQKKRDAAYAWIQEQVEKEKAQVFIICPFIEESESMQTVKAATKEFEILSKEVFKKQKVGLLHGRLKVQEKNKVMEAFKERAVDILVATPVVEVGIDIPGATIILIEGAERFGLAQLHQLRGRVGRSDKQSYCLLFTEVPNPQTLKRLKSLETIQIGAELAELDLRLRGPGELLGTKQHGIPELKVASFQDFALINKTRQAAEQLFLKDPLLKTAPLLKEMLKTYTIQAIEPN